MGFEMRQFGIILQFLTGFYIPFDFKSTSEEITKGLPFFTAVGLIIGMLVYVVPQVLMELNGSLLLHTGLTLAVWVFATGGLHLDGVSDSADGLLSGRERERMLAIMKDSHIGTFGVVALIALLGLKFVAIYSLLEHWQLLPLLIAPVLGRGLAVFASAVYPYAREEGMGNLFIGKVRPSDLWINGLIMIGVLLLLDGLMGILVGLMTVATLWLLLQSIAKKLGGITGDILGLVIEGTELVVILLYALRG